jgi:hypothetical protein
MTELRDIAPDFVGMAHRIVWCSAATVDAAGRPRSRVLHPLWEWNGEALVGWIATSPSPVKLAHLAHSPHISCTYLATNHDTCTADCAASWAPDEHVRIWEAFKHAPAPVGYDPAIIPPWRDGPTSPAFAVLRLEPWRLRVMPGTAMLGGGGEVRSWRAATQTG